MVHIYQSPMFNKKIMVYIKFLNKTIYLTYYKENIILKINQYAGSYSNILFNSHKAV
jgi:hypothetical protein